MYSEALNAMRAQALPPIVDYRVGVVDRGLHLTLTCAPKPPYTFESSSLGMNAGGKQTSRTWIVRFYAANGLGDASLASNKKVRIICAPFPLAPVMLAFVHLAPQPTPSSAPSPLAAASPLDMMKSIVTVRAFYSRSYLIKDVGIVSLGRHPSYHLRFTARDGNESKHPVTDMYVDTATHLVRAVVLGGGQRGFFEGGGGFGRFTFGRVGKYWLVRQIDVEGSGHFLFIHGGGSMKMTFHHFSFPVAAVPAPNSSPPSSTNGNRRATEELH